MRKEGYYWVKVNESRDWEIAFWWNDVWCFPGFTSQIKQVFEIDERRIERSDKDIIDVIKANYPKENLPKYISDNFYLCKPDES